MISRGVVFYNKNSINVIDELELELKDHKTNAEKAFSDYINNGHKFVKVMRSTTNSILNDVRMDNATFYLEYSEDSTINVARIMDGIRDLGLAQESMQHVTKVIRIGKSEVKIAMQGGKRNYIDLADNSDIILIFPTSRGKLEVRLYTDEQNKSLIRVEVEDQETWKELKSCKEEIGKNCLLGGLLVNEAIERGFFIKPGRKLRQPSETISTPKKHVSWADEMQRSRRNQSENILVV